MRNFISLLLVVIIVAFGGYSAYWFFTANNVRTEIEKELAEFSKSVDSMGGDAKFSYSGVSLKGFPNQYKYEINDIALVMGDPALAASTLTVNMDKVTIGNNSALDHFTLTFPEKTDIRIHDFPIEDEKKIDLDFTVAHERRGEIIVDLNKQLEEISMKSIIENLKSLDFSAGSSTLTDNQSKAVVSKLDPSELKLDVTENEKNLDFKFYLSAGIENFNDNYNEDLKPYMQSDLSVKVAKINIDTDGTLDTASSEMYKPFELNITKLDFLTDILDVMILGKASKTAETPLPIADLNVSVAKYISLIQKIAEKELVKMDEAQLAQEFIAEIGVIDPSSPDMVKFHFVSDGNGGMKINDRNMEDVKALYDAKMAKLQEDRALLEQQNGLVPPEGTVPPVDGAPAAPTAPTAPAAPAVPSAPAVPAVPAVPATPAVPAAPSNGKLAPAPVAPAVPVTPTAPAKTAPTTPTAPSAAPATPVPVIPPAPAPATTAPVAPANNNTPALPPIPKLPDATIPKTVN